MNRFVLAVCLVCLCGQSRADLYKCVGQGISYQERPCAGGTTSMPIDSEERQKRQTKEEVRAIEKRLAEREEAERKAEQYRTMMRDQQKLDRRCASILNTVAASKNEIALWDDPNLRYGAEIRKLDAEQAYMRECSGRTR